MIRCEVNSTLVIERGCMGLLLVLVSSGFLLIRYTKQKNFFNSQCRFFPQINQNESLNEISRLCKRISLSLMSTYYGKRRNECGNVDTTRGFV